MGKDLEIAQACSAGITHFSRTFDGINHGLIFSKPRFSTQPVG
jgi:hypothetical protein